MSLSRRNFCQSSIGFAGSFLSFWSFLPGFHTRIPVILATDIGDDIDDTWALGFLLKCPELDLKLILTEYGKSEYRAKLLGKFLEKAGHASIPIAVGPDAEPRGDGAQAEWVKNYDLASY